MHTDTQRFETPNSKLETRILLALLLMLPLSLPADGNDKHSARPKDMYSMRLGDLRITATSVGELAESGGKWRGAEPRPGHHWVVVHIKVTNVAVHPNCTDFDAWLKVNLGYEYDSVWTPLGLSPPKIHDLLPTEESGGRYGFEVKDGAMPVTLILIRNTFAEYACRMMQHRAGVISTPTRVGIPLKGLRSPGN